MHEPPLKRSVTAPNSSTIQSSSPVPSITVTASALGSFTSTSLPRHRSASPYPQSRLHSPDSPRPSDLLCHKDVVLGRSQLLRSTSSVSSVQYRESSNPELHVPLPDYGKSSTSLSRLYESTNLSLDSSTLSLSKTPSIVVSRADSFPGVPSLLEYHSDASSQSYLSADTRTNSPPAYELEKCESGNSGSSRLTSSEDLNLACSESSKKGDRSTRSVRKKFTGYVAAEVQRLSRSDPGVNSPQFQFPILRNSVVPNLSINIEDFGGKFDIGDPDPSFHRSINSPATDHPDEVVLEQVGSFRVHHLRNDSLGELPRISTVKELQQSPPPQSSGIYSPKRESNSPGSLESSSKVETPRSGVNIELPKSIAAPSTAGTSGEIISSTVVLPGEYNRRYHSRAGARSQGNKNIDGPLRISTQTELKPNIIVGTLVTPEGPPATPESPFACISKEHTRLKGVAQNLPSPLITFLSAIEPKVGDGNRKPVPPGKDNPNQILPASPLVTATVVCLAHAHGSCSKTLQPDLNPINTGRPSSLGSMINDNEATLALSAIPSHVDSIHMHDSLGSIITDSQAAIAVAPPHMRSGHVGVNSNSPSLQSVRRIIEKDDRISITNQ